MRYAKDRRRRECDRQRRLRLLLSGLLQDRGPSQGDLGKIQGVWRKARGLPASRSGDGELRRSSEKILTTHVGSLPGLSRFDPSKPDYPEKVAAGVAEIVARQREARLDVINEGEYAKAGDWLSYVDDRFTGFQPRRANRHPDHPAGQGPRGLRGLLCLRDREGHALLCGVGGHQAEAATLGLHRPDRLQGTGRDAARDRAAQGQPEAGGGRLPDGDGAVQLSSLTGATSTTSRRKSSSSPSRKPCVSSTR